MCRSRGSEHELLPRVLQAVRCECRPNKSGWSQVIKFHYFWSLSKIKELIVEKNELLAKITKLEAGMPERQNPAHLSGKKTDDNSLSKQSSQDELQERKKRFRRTSAEIEKRFECIAEGCEKAYG